MPKRASLPEGKSLFYRRPTEDTAEPATDSVAPGAVEKTQFDSEKNQTRQSAIFLEERHLEWLEDKCREARQRGGRAIRKAVIIRALIDVAMESPVDLTSLRHDDELIDRVRKGLRGA